MQKSQSEEEKFILYKLLIKLYEERGHFRKMVGFAVKQFEMVRNSVNKEQVLTASLNLARAKLFLGEHQEAAKMANYVSTKNLMNYFIPRSDSLALIDQKNVRLLLLITF